MPEAENKNSIRFWGTVIVGILGVCILTLFVVRLSTNEDTWVCENGTWIAHGQPSSPMPVSGCESQMQNVPQTPRSVDPAVINCTETHNGKLTLTVVGEEATAFCELPDKTVCEVKALLQGTCGSTESTVTTSTTTLP